MSNQRSAALLSAALVAASSAVLVVDSAAAGPSAAATTAQGVSATPEGSFALSGRAARSFRLPDGMQQLQTTSLSGDRTATRYQQVVDDASVFGGQITVVRNTSGDTVAAVGSYFPGLSPRNDVRQRHSEARDIVEQRVGHRGHWSTALRIDPRTHRLFYEVDSIRRANRPVRWVDAQTGAITKSFNALTEGEGVGVKGDTKTIDTTAQAGRFVMRTADDRQETYDAGNKTAEPGVLESDADDLWNRTKSTFTSPDQRAAVDAHYYAGVVDGFYNDVFNRNSIDDKGMTIISSVHFDRKLCNAFWNGTQMTYGDGDGASCLALSGGLDVVGHELTHGVTEFTSNLIYENESGALNESFSDMMGNTIEFYAARTGADPAARPDWRIGEDVILDTHGFRNMGDPQEFGDPDHYSELFTGPDDNGGVHINSGIPNLAYFLAVNGGANPGCAGSVSGHTHTADCDVTVQPVGLERAEHIFFDGITSLPEFANFCDARNSTVAMAGGESPMISDAWAAVGVHAGCEPATEPPPACVGSNDATIPFASPHPYGNNGNCTWTFHNATPGFAFHFSLLNTEKDFDFVRVRDGDGNLLATFSGASKAAGGVTSPCIPTSDGSVQLETDGGVTAPGFTVDRVVACTPH